MYLHLARTDPGAQHLFLPCGTLNRWRIGIGARRPVIARTDAEGFSIKHIIYCPATVQGKGQFDAHLTIEVINTVFLYWRWSIWDVTFLLKSILISKEERGRIGEPINRVA
jgi:hypothetical protein